MEKEDGNRLKPENCNKSHCKSCIFHPVIDKRVRLSPEREAEIISYLMKFESSHICHQTNKTCYGGLEKQAEAAFAMKIIAEPTVECFLETANKYLNHEKTN